MNFLYNLFENDILFYGLFGAFGYKLGSSFLGSLSKDFKLGYTDIGTQTSSWEDYSDRASLIASDRLSIQDNLTSLDTVTPLSENFETATIQTTSDLTSVTTILPVPPVEISMIPNPDITRTLVDQGVQTIDFHLLLEPSVINSLPVSDIINLLS